MNDLQMTWVKSNPWNSEIAFFNVLCSAFLREAPLGIVSHGKSDKYFTEQVYIHNSLRDFSEPAAPWLGWSEARDCAPEQICIWKQDGGHSEGWWCANDNRHRGKKHLMTKKKFVKWFLNNSGILTGICYTITFFWQQLSKGPTHKRVLQTALDFHIKSTNSCTRWPRTKI